MRAQSGSASYWNRPLLRITERSGESVRSRPVNHYKWFSQANWHSPKYSQIFPQIFPNIPKYSREVLFAQVPRNIIFPGILFSLFPRIYYCREYDIHFVLENKMNIMISRVIFTRLSGIYNLFFLSRMFLISFRNLFSQNIPKNI